MAFRGCVAALTEKQSGNTGKIPVGRAYLEPGALHLDPMPAEGTADRPLAVIFFGAGPGLQRGLVAWRPAPLPVPRILRVSRTSPRTAATRLHSVRSVAIHSAGRATQLPQ
jgi:hypothetical protein